MNMTKLGRALVLGTLMMARSVHAEVAPMEISIEGISFVPAATVVKVGQLVRWTNTTRMAHTVTLDPNQAANPENILFPEGAEFFDSGKLAPGAVFETTFTVPGKYRYICKPHESMGHIGEIEVVPAGGL